MDSQAFVGLLDKVTKDWTRQRKQELKDQQAILRRREKLTVVRRLSQKEVAYAYMPTAYLKASAQGTLPAHARQIMYAARGYIQSKTGETLSDEYFTQNLLPSYLIDYPEKTRDWDVVFDARGHLVEPHTGHSLPLGTLQVRQYLFACRFSCAFFASVSRNISLAVCKCVHRQIASVGAAFADSRF